MLSENQELFKEAELRGDRQLMDAILQKHSLPEEAPDVETSTAVTGAVQRPEPIQGVPLAATTPETDAIADREQDLLEAEMLEKSLDETPAAPLAPVQEPVPEPEAFKVPTLEGILGPVPTAPKPKATRFFTDTQKNENNKSLPESKSGYNKKTNTWTPYKSLEGGTDTLAYGHKLTKTEQDTGIILIQGEPVDVSEGITDTQADSLLAQDIAVQEKQASTFLSKKFKTDWESLTENQQAALLDVEFNAGLRKFPKYTKAVIEQDWEEAAKQLRDRHYKKNGKKVQLKARNDFVIQNYLKA